MLKEMGMRTSSLLLIGISVAIISIAPANVQKAHDDQNTKKTAPLWKTSFLACVEFGRKTGYGLNQISSFCGSQQYPIK
jgi:hypothetical protein